MKRVRLTNLELEALIHAASMANEEPATWEEYSFDDPDRFARACTSGLRKLREMLAGRR